MVLIFENSSKQQNRALRIIWYEMCFFHFTVKRRDAGNMNTNPSEVKHFLKLWACHEKRKLTPIIVCRSLANPHENFAMGFSFMISYAILTTTVLLLFVISRGVSDKSSAKVVRHSHFYKSKGLLPNNDQLTKITVCVICNAVRCSDVWYSNHRINMSAVSLVAILLVLFAF